MMLHKQLKDLEGLNEVTNVMIEKVFKENKENYLSLENLGLMLSGDDVDDFALGCDHIKIPYKKLKLLMADPVILSLTPVKLRQNQQSFAEQQETIFHFYSKNDQPHASEYADGYASDSQEEDENAIEQKIHKSIVISSHGIGSGIYGIYDQDVVEQEQQKGSTCHPFTILNPFIVKDSTHAVIYTNTSLHLMRVSKYIALLTIQLKKASKSPENLLYGVTSQELRRQVVSSYMKDSKNEEELNRLITEIKQLFKQGGYVIDDVEQALQACLEQFNIKAKDSIATPMPINYLMKQQGFGGMIATKESGWDSFSKGCVLFICDDTDKPDVLKSLPMQKRSERISKYQATPPRNVREGGIDYGGNSVMFQQRQLTPENSSDFSTRRCLFSSQQIDKINKDMTNLSISPNNSPSRRSLN